MSLILIVDDDPQLRQSFERLLATEKHQTIAAPSGEKGVEAVREHSPDLVFMDVRLPGMDGLTAYQRIKEIAPKLPVIIMTAYGTTDTAIEATKMGAFDYILKPFDIPEVLNLIQQALKAGRFMRSPVAVGTPPKSPTDDALIGNSPVMQNLYKSIGRVAPTDATVLLRGESGTGKELVARAIYHHSLRASNPFLVINCVAIPETLLESELFGYEKGAFTGANSRRAGKIERANRGSFFLDEIGDMPFSIQSKILRLLQEKNVERLGGREPIKVDVRIIAATNRDLEAAVSLGKFREDLYYRLNVVTISLPPLRERPGDIAHLARHFLSVFSLETGLENPGISSKALEALGTHTWPGNVRELANVLQKALIFSRGLPLEAGDIERSIRGEEQTGPCRENLGHVDKVIAKWARAALRSGKGDRILEALLDHAAGIIVGQALEEAGGNRTHASKMLGVSRPTLISKIDKYNLNIKTKVD